MAAAGGPAEVRGRPTVAAVIDIGSNSVLLLTVAVQADGHARARDAELLTTRLGTRLAVGGPLDPAAAERTQAAVVALATRARRTGATRLWAFATAAVRLAADGAAFARGVEEAAALPVEVLSGEREATLAYAAVARGLPGLGRPLLVADVGGGTTELTLGAGDEPQAAESLPLGALVLTERHLDGTTDRGAARGRLRAEVEAVLSRTELPGYAAGVGATLAASGGTATALAALDVGLTSYEPRRVHGHSLSRSTLGALVARVVRGDVPLSGLDPRRAAVLPAGAIVLEAIAVASGAVAVHVSEHAVRHAYLRERLAADGIVATLADLWP